MDKIEEKISKKITQLVKAEVTWQKSRHIKSREEFIKHMSNFYHSLFNVEYNVAKTAVVIRLMSENSRDLAKQYENKQYEKNDQGKACIYWDSAEMYLLSHFKELGICI